MNLLEHFIIKVHSVKELENYPDMIEVDVTCNCWGSIERTIHTTTKTGWQQELERGWFLA